MTPYFLVHHALADGNTSYVERFFDDVQNAVFGRVGHRAEFAGRLVGVRRPVPSGRDDGDAIEPSPLTMSCPVLVALYSDAYFADGQVALEWSLFHERVRWHRQFTGRHSSALVGVRWSVHAEETSQVLADVDVLAGDFGDDYRAAGASRLMRAHPASEFYRNLVERVAEGITANTGDAVPAMSKEDVRYVRTSRNLFPAPLTPGFAARVPGPSVSSVDETGVGVVLAVAPASQQPEQRTQRLYYGDDAVDWQPFLPEVVSSAFAITRDALENYSYSGVVHVSLGEDLAEQLGRAAEEGRVLVLLVDPWIAASDNYTPSLALLGEWRRRHPSVAGTLVIVNPADGETRNNVEELRERLHQVLRRDQEGTESRTWRDAVHTADQLVAHTIPLVARTRNTLIGMPAELRRGPGVPERESPTVDTPGGGPQTERADDARIRPTGAERSRRPILRRAVDGRSHD